MAEIRKQSGEQRDYKERFAFILTTGDNIICKRYFRINNFNPKSEQSYELTSAVRHCAAEIDRDLKDKTAIYLERYAPKTFNSYEEMVNFVTNEENAHRMSLGEGLVVRGNSKTDYYYTGEGTVKELGSKFDDGEITENDAELNKSTYKFAFLDDEREVCAYQWDGYYPKFVISKNMIDITNKKGKYDENDIDRLSFEQYLLYKMSEGKSDLSYGLIKSLCYACSFQDSGDYTTSPDKIIEDWNNDSARQAYGSL